MTKNVQAFVTLSTHEKNGKRFIRARFPIGDNEYRTAFNPKGVAQTTWVKRTSKLTGEERVQSRWPVDITFVESETIGDDVVKSCVFKDREFIPAEIEAAQAEDLEAIDAL